MPALEQITFSEFPNLKMEIPQHCLSQSIGMSTGTKKAAGMNVAHILPEYCLLLIGHRRVAVANELRLAPLLLEVPDCSFGQVPVCLPDMNGL